MANADIADCASLYDSAGFKCAAPAAAPTTSGPCTYAITLPTAGTVTSDNCLVNPAFVFTAGAPATCTGTSTIVATCSGTAATGATFSA